MTGALGPCGWCADLHRPRPKKNAHSDGEVSPWTELEQLLSASRAHESALRRAREAGDARAIAVYRARRAGLTLRDVARVLGCKHAAIPDLARRGAALVGEGHVMTNSPESMQRPGPDVAPETALGTLSGALEGGGGQVMTDSPESTQGDYVTFEVVRRCLRDACHEAALANLDFCPEHLWT